MENGETIESAANNEAEDTKDEAESVGGKNDEDEGEEEKEDGDNNNDDDDGASTGDTKDEDEVSTVPSAPPAEDLQEPWEYVQSAAACYV